MSWPPAGAKSTKLAPYTVTSSWCLGYEYQPGVLRVDLGAMCTWRLMRRSPASADHHGKTGRLLVRLKSGQSTTMVVKLPKLTRQVSTKFWELFSRILKNYRIIFFGKFLYFDFRRTFFSLFLNLFVEFCELRNKYCAKNLVTTLKWGVINYTQNFAIFFVLWNFAVLWENLKNFSQISYSAKFLNRIWRPLRCQR